MSSRHHRYAVRTYTPAISSLDQLNALPSGALRERPALTERQYELRRALTEIELPGSDQIKERWTERAGRKPAEDEGKPVIPSPIKSGGSI